MEDPLPELPIITPRSRPQPDAVSWPTLEWPRGSGTPELDELVKEAFSAPELSTTNAVVVVQNGRIIAERYGGAKEFFDRPPEPITESTPLISWSMAKSMAHFLIGLLVDEGQLDPDERAPVPEWADSADPRHAIKLRDLLAMRDGLNFVEEYVDGELSNTLEMLFGEGRSDMASYTAALALRHPPDTVFNYSSGTTNVLSRIIADRVGYGPAYREFLSSRLFNPIGMRTAEPTFDDAGVFIASSYVHATAQDFARFGLLYLRGGEWDGQQLVSSQWTNTAQIPHSVDVESGVYYSWQWWVTGDEFGTYWANGYDGQQISVVPELDVVLVRLGRTPAERGPALREWRHRVLCTLAS